MKYKAFISYKHLDLDIAVAEKLHALLNQYVIPRELRINGERKLGRVFRDLNNLPLTHDLTEDIRAALDESENLIVICSPATPESFWVQREIEYFIERHGCERIFVVLAAGTMQESVPKQLTEIYAPDGVTIVKQIEPLAAMIAADTKKQTIANLKREFPRLIAGILNCPYHHVSQLENRRALARLLKLLTVILLIAAAFIGLLLAKNSQISRLLRESQLNEAKAAVYAADILLESNNRKEALQTVLDVVNDGTERPYSPDAERLLTEALGAYEPVIGYRDGEIWQNTDIETIVLSSDGQYLVTLDDSKNLRSYETAGKECLWTIPAADLSPAEMRNMTTVDPRTDFVHEEVRELAGHQPLLLWETADSYTYLHFSTGQIAAQIAAPFPDSMHRAYSPDGRTLVTYGTELTEGQNLTGFTAYDTTTGKIKWRYQLPVDSEPEATATEETDDADRAAIRERYQARYAERSQSSDLFNVHYLKDGSIILTHLNIFQLFSSVTFDYSFFHMAADGTLLNTTTHTEDGSLLAQQTAHYAGWVTLSLRREALRRYEKAYLQTSAYLVDDALYCQAGTFCIRYDPYENRIDRMDARHYHIDHQGYETILANGTINHVNVRLGMDLTLNALPTSLVASAQSSGDNSVLCLIHSSAPEVVLLYRFEPNPFMLSYHQPDSSQLMPTANITLDEITRAIINQDIERNFFRPQDDILYSVLCNGSKNNHCVIHESTQTLVQYDRDTKKAVMTYTLEALLPGSDVEAQFINSDRQLLVEIQNPVPGPSGQHFICLFDTGSGQLLARYPMEATLPSILSLDVRLLPDQRKIYVFDSYSNIAGLCINMDNWAVVAEIPGLKDVSEDGRLLLCEYECDSGDPSLLTPRSRYVFPVLTYDELISWAVNPPETVDDAISPFPEDYTLD